MYETLKKLEDLLKEKLKGKITSFFIDNPNLIPMSQLPCIAISPVSTEIDIADTGRDEHVHQIEIHVMMNALTELTNVENQMVGIEFLTKIVEERDTDGKPVDYSILGILRDKDNIKLGDNWNIGNVGTIEYGLTQRLDQDIVKEAILTLTVIRMPRR